MKRGDSGLCALIALDKPLDVTSHDVVNRVRRIVGEKRVGHAGTLDPAATGLLIVGIGPATRLSPYLTSDVKRYAVRIDFGSATNTDDAQGEVIATASVPEELCDPFFAVGFLKSLIGHHEQVPPAFSAIKKDGKKAYQAAREGESLELDSRPFEIIAAELLSVDCGDTCSWDVDFTVSKGTYIRAIARDMGEALGTKAHVSALRRTACGKLGISSAVTLEQLEERGLSAVCINPVTALGFPTLEIEENDILPLYQGKQLTAPASCEDGLVSLIHKGKLFSVHECVSGILRAKTVIPGGVIGA